MNSIQRTKIFTAGAKHQFSSYGELIKVVEKKINNWLEGNPLARIVGQSLSHGEGTVNAMVTYEIKEV